jgi:hypothetical protein
VERDTDRWRESQKGRGERGRETERGVERGRNREVALSLLRAVSELLLRPKLMVGAMVTKHNHRCGGM